ncbi:MAG: hypothetical protein HPY76_11860 [Anaerolineae bacterium]|nr:hypothetical protein [Anaerolineae bacterium]
MKLFFRFLTFLLIFLVAAELTLHLKYDRTYPEALGPEFDEYMRTRFLDQIKETQPQFFLMGDSMLRDSIDQAGLRDLTGLTIEYADVPGSGSALWYLILKNNIALAPNTPQYLVIFFRDTMLTSANFRVDGKYLAMLDEYAGEDEALLLERAYIMPMPKLEQFMESYLPMYRTRDDLLELSGNNFKSFLPFKLLGCSVDCVDEALKSVFSADNFDILGLDMEVDAKENSLYDPIDMQFDHQVERSFLPEIIRLAHEKDMQLIMVRMKTTRHPTRADASKELLAYMDDLDAYLATNEIILMDYAFDERVLDEWFKDAVHIQRSDRMKFTEIFAQDLLYLLGANPGLPVDCPECKLKHATPQPE